MEPVTTKVIVARAWKESLEDLRLEKPVRRVTGLAIPIASGILVHWITGSWGIASFVGVALVLAFLVIVFLWKMFTVPKAIAAEARAESGELAAKIAELQQQIANLTAPPPPPARGPDAIYQYGDEVGGVVGARRVPNSSLFWFDQINHQGRFDPNAEFEYREWVLLKRSYQREARAMMVGAINGALVDVEAEIVRKRDNT